MERIDCQAPLPKDPTTALLTEMLVPAPYKVPKKKAEKKAPGTRVSGVMLYWMPHPKTTSHAPPTKGRRKRKGPPHPGRPEGLRRRPWGPGRVPGARPSYPRRLMTKRQIPLAEAGETRRNSTSPYWGQKKRKATPEGEAGMSKKGKVSLPDYSATAADSEEGWLPGRSP